MIKISFSYVLTMLAIVLMSNAALAKDLEPGQSVDGLKLVKKTIHGELLVNTSVDWNRFTEIQLERATVEFRKHWARDQKNRSGNRPTEKNMGRIKSDLSELLDEVFRDELPKNNAFTMSDKSGENVMRITPGITNLDIYAPDRMRNHIGSSFADSKGSMTLEIEIHDSVNGTLLARMIDSRSDPQKNYLEWATTGTNLRAARFMFIRWAIKLREWLIEAGAADQD